jgi:hypothetical protein
MVSYTGIVSIISLIYYIPCIGCSIFLASRHGFGRSSGWIFLALLGLLRVVGDSLQLASESHPDDIGLYTGAAICSSIGLAPLFITTIGLLLRVNDLTNAPLSENKTHWALTSYNLPVIVATILAIVGGVQASDNVKTTGEFALNGIFKAGIVLFGVAFLCIVVSTAIVAARARSAQIDSSEKRLVAAVIIALPILLVRLIYAFLFTFAKSAKFSLIGGDETVQLCMQVIEEWLVVFIYLAAGLMLKKLVKSNNAPTPSPAADGGENGGVSGKRQRGGAARYLRYVPIAHWFVR